MSKTGILIKIALVALPLGLALFATGGYGVGITPDSVAYVSSARSLVSAGVLTVYDGEPLVSWPPLFPALIAIPSLGGIDPLTAARFLNALMVGLIVLFGSLLIRNTIGDRPLVFVGIMMLLLSESLLTVGTRVWSEPLFVLLATIFLFSMQRFLDTDSSTSLVVALLVAALAPLARYVGVTVIVAGGVMLLLRVRARFRARLFQSLLFITIASMPTIMWLIRNYGLSGSLTGPRAPAEITLLRNAGLAVGTLSEWFLPSALGIGLFAWLAGKPRAQRGESIQADRSVLASAVFVVVYILLLALSVALVGVDPIDHRLLSPIYVPLLLLLLVWLDRRRGPASGQAIGNGRLWTTLAIALWLFWPLVDTGLRVIDYRRNGIRTYSTRAWSESELMKQVSEIPPDEFLFSNAPDAVYIRTGRTALFSPYKREELTLEKSHRRLEKFLDLLRSDSAAHLAWFSPVHRNYLFSVDELRAKCEVEPVREFTDGTLYRLQARLDIQ